MVWTAPKTWALREPIDETDLQEQIAGNTEWLYERPYEYLYTDNTVNPTDATDYSAAGVHKTLYAFGQITLTEETVVELIAQWAVSPAAIRTIFMDIYITPSVGSAIYASNGLTTKPTVCYQVRVPANEIVQTDFSQRVTLAAGTYSLSIVAWYGTGATTLTSYHQNSRELGLLRVLY